MGRARKTEAEKKKTFGVSLLLNEIDEITTEAIRCRITPASFGAALLIRGWKAYLRDGLLDEPVTEIVNEDAIKQDDLRQVKLAKPKTEKVRKAR
jgi:hypothetical protein